MVMQTRLSGNCQRRSSGRRVGALYALLFLVFATSALAQERRTLHGIVPPAALQIVPSGELPASRSLRLALVLTLRNQEVLATTLHELYDPTSPNYHHWLTSQQFSELFGPTKEDVEKATEFSEKYGLTVLEVAANRMIVDVSGTAGDMEKAFKVRMVVRPHPSEDRTFFGPDVEPSVESDVPISDIDGIDDFAVIRANYHVQANDVISNQTGSAPGSGYRGNDFRAAYAPGVSLEGTGQTIGLFEFSTTCYASDLTAYCQQCGIRPINISYVILDGMSATPNGDTGEQSLDVEDEHAMAPGANIIYYLGTSSMDILNRIASDDICKSSSASFIVSPAPSGWNATLEEMAAQGQSMCGAVGDSGFLSSPFGWDDNPYMTQVGGTDLTTTEPGGAWSSETGWSGTSGSIASNAWAIPSWQTGISMTACGGSPNWRNSPDVAMPASSVWMVWHSGTNSVPTSGNIGGTSCSSPSWAGFMALVNQQAAMSGSPSAGFINPAIYSILKGTGSVSYAGAFHDITSGNNGKPCVVGYDLVTGVGTPNGQALINGLAGTNTTTNFSLGATPPLVSVLQGSMAISATTTVAVIPGTGFNGTVSLSVSGLPSGVTASFSPASATVTSTLTFTASAMATVGTALVTITGASGSLTHTNNLSLTVINTSVNADFGFEVPSIGSGNFEYDPPGALWTFAGASPNGSGIVANGSGFSNPNAPQGVQAAFIQENGSVSQTLSGFSPGTNFTFTYSAAQRDGANQHGGESWNVLIDGTVIKSNNPGSTSYAPYSTGFTASAVTHTLTFAGTDLAGGDNTVFIDNVKISPSLNPLPPSVVLTSPTNNANFIVPATVNLAATVASNGNLITGVQFYSDSVTLITEVTNPPYTYLWTNAAWSNSTTDNGHYSVFARAIFDGDGSTDSAAANIAVINTNFNFSFEIPTIGAGNFEYNPTGAVWTFCGSSPDGSGLLANGSAFSNPNAPLGTQAGFIEEHGMILQTLSGFSPGTNYTFTYSAAQRSGANQHGGES
jgi:hypothetical protein